MVLENIENYYNFASGKGLLERLAAGPVIGDGGFIFALEKRGFVKVSKTLSCQTLFSKLTKKIFLTFQAGPWTPEATVEHPDAVGHLPSTLFFSFVTAMIQFSNYRHHLQIQTQGASASQGVPEGRLGCDAGDGNK